ncbi:hypothetical protein WMY93_024912 [Mugilogobius chulae]|uniref:Uncharacterized protein n=1 Tax=Mugilogobius chulae TaxID=88201 RepID=A0AAW0N5D4_9GOBI
MFGYVWIWLHTLSLIVGVLLVGSWAETTLRHLNPDTVGTDFQSRLIYTSNMTAQHIRSRRSTDAAHFDILGPSHLSALRNLLSDRKITVRFGLRISVPDELLEPQLQLLLNKQPVLYNAGNKAGLFSMRVLEIKKISNTL